MILGLRTAIYPVGDLAAARQWYAQVFERQPYFDEPFYVGFVEVRDMDSTSSTSR